MLQEFVYCSSRSGFLNEHFIGERSWEPGKGLMIWHKNGSVTLLGGVLLPLVKNAENSDAAFFTAALLQKKGAKGWIFQTPNKKGVWLPNWKDLSLEILSLVENPHCCLAISGARLADPAFSTKIYDFPTLNLPRFIAPEQPSEIFVGKKNYWILLDGPYTYQNSIYRIPRSQVEELVGVSKEQVRKLTLRTDNDALKRRITRWFFQAKWTWADLYDLLEQKGKELPSLAELPEEIRGVDRIVKRPCPETALSGQDWVTFLFNPNPELGGFLSTSAWELFTLRSSTERSELIFQNAGEVVKFIATSEEQPCEHSVMVALDNVGASAPYTADDLIAAAQKILSTPGKDDSELKWAERTLWILNAS